MSSRNRSPIRWHENLWRSPTQAADASTYGGNVFVELYPDRLVIASPGGLPPGLSPAKFGIKSVHRNPLIADIFSRARKVERAGTGIRRIRGLLAQAGCAEPEFVFNGFVDLIFPRRSPQATTGQVTGQVEEMSQPYARSILAYCRTPRALKEIMAKVGIKKRDNLMPHIRPLLQVGFLTLTIPDKPRSRFQRYVTTAEGRKWLKEVQA